jgi:molybdopterin molybdotransferase
VLSVSDAARSVVERMPRMPAERVDIGTACGRVLAEDIVATRALPGFDNSAMDGYAARSADLPATLPIAASIAAGELAPGEVPARSTARILTGAPLPPGADTVVMQEDATRDGDRVALPASPPGENIRRAGEDIAIGDTVLRAGTRLSPWDLGVLAALGVDRVPVAQAPRVAIISTGDELVDIATTPLFGQLVDSSSYALAALVSEAGGRPQRIGICRDDLAALTGAIGAALACDAVITTGGVSVGDRDYMHAALDRAGVQLALWKVAMKPGKPFSFGMRGERPVFGLPGNPVSTIVAFELFLRPALLAMQGATVIDRPRVPVALPAGYAKPAGRAHYLRARVVRDGGALVAHPHAKQGSAMLSSLVGCNALVEIAADATAVAPGAIVPAILLEPV